MTTTAAAAAAAAATTTRRRRAMIRSTTGVRRTFHVFIGVVALVINLFITTYYSTTVVVAATSNRGFFPSSTITAAHKFWRHRNNNKDSNRNTLNDNLNDDDDDGGTRGAQAPTPPVHSLLRSIPAFSKIPRNKRSSSNNNSNDAASVASPPASFFLWRTEEASVKTKKRPLPTSPSSPSPSLSESEPPGESELDTTEDTTSNNTNNNMPAPTQTRQREVPFKRPSLPSLPSFPSLPSIPSSIVPSFPPFPSLKVDPKFFMGITPETILYKTSPYNSNSNNNSNNNKPKKKVKKRVDLREGMSEALEELRSMRYEMEQMRKELAKLQQMQMGGVEATMEPPPAISVPDPVAQQRQQQEALARRQREYEALAQQVEQWAEEILFPTANNNNNNNNKSNNNNNKQQDAANTSNDGWVEVECHKMLRSKFNPDGTTRAYLKWMKDSRGPTDITRESASPESAKFAPGDQEWPCIRLYATIDAPLDDVCLYLSQAERVEEYNTLLDGHRDLEEITPHSKICSGQTPQILFVKPRDFVTFCSHRWRRDGTQVIINEACDGHRDAPVNAHAIRGATFIGPHPSGDPNRTHIAMVAHASPGADVPSWACKAAIQSLAPLEPFRLFYRINRGVQEAREELRALQAAELVRSAATGGNPNSSNTSSSSSSGSGTASRPTAQRRPAGWAQMGFACFWPNGGGELETEASATGERDGNGNDKDGELPKH